MSPSGPSTPSHYAGKLAGILTSASWDGVSRLSDWMAEAWRTRKQVFICGNGGSAANALHWANDFTYPLTSESGAAIRIHALPANVSCISCIANDLGYEEIFAHQLSTFAEPGDILIVLSGSGNSPNVVRALEKAREIGMKTAALLGFSGGKCLALAELPIHFAVDDMQIVEDIQEIVGHMVMRSLKGRKDA